MDTKIEFPLPLTIMYETVGPHPCPTCDNQGGWLDGDMGVVTHWKVCPDCGPRAGADLDNVISELDEWYATPGIDLSYRKVRKLVDALRYINARVNP